MLTHRFWTARHVGPVPGDRASARRLARRARRSWSLCSRSIPFAKSPTAGIARALRQAIAHQNDMTPRSRSFSSISTGSRPSTIVSVTRPVTGSFAMSPACSWPAFARRISWPARGRRVRPNPMALSALPGVSKGSRRYASDWPAFARPTIAFPALARRSASRITPLSQPAQLAAADRLWTTRPRGGVKALA